MGLCAIARLGCSKLINTVSYFPGGVDGDGMHIIAPSVQPKLGEINLTLSPTDNLFANRLVSGKHRRHTHHARLKWTAVPRGCEVPWVQAN